MAFDDVVFGNKKLSDMFADVYSNTDSKRSQINAIIENLIKLVRTPDDAVIITPLIKDFLDVNVKNDEHIVRLVQIAQRLVALEAKTSSGGNDILTDEEKQQLINNVREEFAVVVNEQEDLQDELESVKAKA